MGDRSSDQQERIKGLKREPCARYQRQTRRRASGSASPEQGSSAVSPRRQGGAAARPSPRSAHPEVSQVTAHGSSRRVFPPPSQERGNLLCSNVFASREANGFQDPLFTAELCRVSPSSTSSRPLLAKPQPAPSRRRSPCFASHTSTGQISRPPGRAAGRL